MNISEDITIEKSDKTNKKYIYSDKNFKIFMIS